MPKIADVKSKSRSKRRPLRDVSNGGFKPSISNPVTKKSNPDTQQQDPVTTCGGGVCQDPLDRLLLVHSDLSVLIRQIDELVIQALEQKVTNKKEIESFAHVLNEMQTSLKPWIPRFQKLLSTHVETNLASKKIPPSINKDTSENLDNPDTYNLDFLVSPSPLVSWRADCNQEGGRNLFMLTPLPKPSAFSSKLKKSSNPVKMNIKIEPFSPEKVVKRNNSIFISTPHLKMSPPKSCILLEPASEYCNKNTKGTKTKTKPKPKPPTSRDSEPSSSSQPSGHLGLKYPEIFGIRPAHELANARKAVETSPNWCILSPPKTCVFLEPSDDQTVIKDVAKARNEVKGVIDATPMCKDVDTTVVRGWRAGENTLKKELWMRFEAATGHEFRFKANAGSCVAVEEKSGDNKGFLDLLEEASCEDKKLVV